MPGPLATHAEEYESKGLPVYSSSSPIASGTGWSNSIDISNEAKWFTALAPTVRVVMHMHAVPPSATQARNHALKTTCSAAGKHIPRRRVSIVEHLDVNLEHWQRRSGHNQDHLSSFIPTVSMRRRQHEPSKPHEPLVSPLCSTESYSHPHPDGQYRITEASSRT